MTRLSFFSLRFCLDKEAVHLYSGEYDFQIPA